MPNENLNQQRIQQENKMIEDAFQHLLDTYLASPHQKKTEIITKAFNFARKAHEGVRRLSGEPYIMHPISVAQIACEEMGLGSTSICAALLHDVIEDTVYNEVDIENIFGEKIAQIVQGLTKISGGIFGEQASAQTENFKKLLLTMNDDIRVILIKICDRLHNMRTLDSQSPNKQYKIAGETLYIYVPIASRLGFHKIKSELEDLCFKFEHPNEYQHITQQLKLSKEQRDKLFNDFTAPIRQALDKEQVQYQIIERVKTPYAIWSKMLKKQVSYDEIYDILAVRIIITPKDINKEVDECMLVYDAIKQIYKIHSERTRDWLRNPKSNGYEALHATFMSKQGRWIEVQIRSQRMHDIAERGLAAHWKYKREGIFENEDKRLTQWLDSVKEILDDPQPDTNDFLDAIKLNLFSTEIAVFTPKGEILHLPLNSTALDFAYHIHTVLGNHCIGAKVNHKLVPVSHQLRSGDQVEILTSAAQHPQEEWLNFVNTAKAQNKIKAALRRQNREIQKQGETLLVQWLQSLNLQPTSQLLERMCRINHAPRLNDLYLAIGNHTITLDNRQQQLLQNTQDKKKKNWIHKLFSSPQSPSLGEGLGVDVSAGLFQVGQQFNKKIPVVIDEMALPLLKFPDCCHPIPGDDILGFINDNRNIEIHLRKCNKANILKTTYGNRILDAQWNMHRKILFPATLILEGIDRKSMLLDVAKVVSTELDVNIQSITISADKGIFRGNIQLKVYDRSDIKLIMQKLKHIKGIQEVQQYL